MKRRIIFIGGIHGVGKSTFCQSLASRIKAKHFSASELIMMVKTEESTRSKRVKNINKNQDILICAINEYLNDDVTYFFDGHFCLINDAGEIRKVPEQTFRSISPIALLVLHDEPHNIHKRLNNRDNKKYDLDFIDDFQKQELAYSKQVADSLNIPYCSCNPFTNQNNIYEFVVNVLGKGTN